MRRIAFGLTALALGVAACGTDGDDDARASRATVGREGSFLGTAGDGGTYVAIVVDREGDALAFVTDGDRSVDWLHGTVDDGTGELDNDGGALLEVAFTKDGATGTFTRPRLASLSFQAAKATAPAGLYRASEPFADGDYVAGWIVLPDGTQRGAIRRYETPLPPGAVDPATFSPGDETFAVPGGVLMPRRFDATADV